LKTSDDDVRGSGESILKEHYCRSNYENCSDSACTDREAERRRERQRMKQTRRRPKNNSEEQEQEMEGGEE